jgi:hypothetical protein
MLTDEQFRLRLAKSVAGTWLFETFSHVTMMYREIRNYMSGYINALLRK